MLPADGQASQVRSIDVVMQQARSRHETSLDSSWKHEIRASACQYDKNEQMACKTYASSGDQPPVYQTARRMRRVSHRHMKDSRLEVFGLTCESGSAHAYCYPV